MLDRKPSRVPRQWLPTSWWGRGASLFVLTLVVTASVVAAVKLNEPISPEETWIASTQPAQEGDRVWVHLTAFTADGQPIRTTSYTAATVLNRTHGLELFEAELYEPADFVLGSGDVGLLGTVVESYLYGTQPGDRIVTDVIDANDTVTGAAGEPQVVPRRYGPFPVEETVPEEKFRVRFPNATTGDVVQLNPRFYAEVEAVTAGEVTYRFLVQDGDVVPMPALGPTATLTIEVEGDVFYDVASAEPGSAFQRRNDRVLNITHGPYLIQDVTEASIVLQPLKSNLFDYALQDLYFVLEVESVEKEASR